MDEPLIYGEYIQRLPQIPLAVFRAHGAQDWVGDGDQLVANLARTMKMGPEPHYMAWWRIGSIDRMDSWEAHFRTAEGRLYLAESPVGQAMTFARCGLWRILAGADPLGPGLHLVEFFAADGVPDPAVRQAFAARQQAAAAAGGHLAWLLVRLGLMAPDPGGMALWSFDSYRAAAPFLAAAPGAAGAVRVMQAGLYRRFGEDIA